MLLRRRRVVQPGQHPRQFVHAGVVLQSLYSAGLDPQPINVIDHGGPTYRTSKELYSYTRFQHVPVSQRKRGDLLFYTSNGSASGVYHVAIYLGNGQMMESVETHARVSAVRPGNLAPIAVRPFS